MQMVLPNFFLLSYAAEQDVFLVTGGSILTSTVGIETVDQFPFQT